MAIGLERSPLPLWTTKMYDLHRGISEAFSGLASSSPREDTPLSPGSVRAASTPALRLDIQEALIEMQRRKILRRWRGVQQQSTITRPLVQVTVVWFVMLMAFGMHFQSMPECRSPMVGRGYSIDGPCQFSRGGWYNMTAQEFFFQTDGLPVFTKPPRGKIPGVPDVPTDSAEGAGMFGGMNAGYLPLWNGGGNRSHERKPQVAAQGASVHSSGDWEPVERIQVNTPDHELQIKQNTYLMFNKFDFLNFAGEIASECF